MALAYGMAISCGLLKKTAFDPSSCARCLSMRIGEASNPGPERLGVFLEDTPLVEAKTASLQAKVWKRFVFWIRSKLSRSTAESVPFKSSAPLHIS